MSKGLLVRKHVSLAALAIAIIALPFSTKICHSGIIVFLLLWIFEGNLAHKIAVISNSILLQLLILFFLLGLIGILYTENISQGWFSLEKKIFLLFLPVALATTQFVFEKKEIHYLLYLFVASCFVGTLLCIFNSFHQANLVTNGESINTYYLSLSNFKKLNLVGSSWLLFSYTSLSDGIHIHPTYFSVYITFCIVFLLIQLLQHGHHNAIKISHWILIGYFLIFTVFLSSRIVTLCLFVILLFCIIYHLRSQRARSLSFALLILLSLVWGGVLYYNPISRYRNLQEISANSLHIEANQFYENSTQIRASLWWTALKSFANTNPIWGAGTGDVEAIMRKSSIDNNVSNILRSYDPHNQYLYTLLSQGILGVLVLVSLLGLIAYLSYINQDYLQLTFLFIFASLCLTETALELQKGTVFFALFWSLLAFQRRSYQLISINLKPLTSARN